MQNSILKKDVVESIESMLDHLFFNNYTGKFEAEIIMDIRNSKLYVFRHKERLMSLDELYKTYRVVKEYNKFKFGNYDEMIQIVRDEQLECDINYEMYAWTRKY